MKTIRPYLIVVLILCFAQGNSQSNQMLRRQAYEATLIKDWHSASQYYNRLYMRDSTQIKLQYQYADAARLNFEIPLALHLYHKVAALDNGRRFPLTFYWIGQLLKHKGEYKEAKKWFGKYYKLRIRTEKYKSYQTKARHEMEACDLAQILVSNPVIPHVDHVDNAINSKQSEYSPFETDSMLYFSSVRTAAKREPGKTEYSKIYTSKFSKGKWQKVRVLDTMVNSPRFHNANVCLSPDKKWMVYSRCKEVNAADYSCELYTSEFRKNKWQAGLPLEEPINLPGFSSTQPNFGEINGRTVLFFSSNRPGGRGGMDIWYAVKNADGSYEKPVNAGHRVNSNEDEITPWFLKEEKTLYFSSTYHKGLGSFDIFKSRYDSIAFTEPENAGFPINSGYNDIYFSMNGEGSRVYLSSNRPGSLFEGQLNCCNDLYSFDIKKDEPPPAVVVDTVKMQKAQMKLLVPLTLYFHNDQPDPKTTQTVTTKNYATTFIEYKALSPTYVKEYSRGLKGDDKTRETNNVENFFSDSVDTGFEDLARFAELLEKVLLNGETVKITMKGYCSPLASTDYNVKLAKRRISSLRNYFYEYKDGWFKKYIDNPNSGEGRITFEDVDIGELPASRVSADLQDKRNSVYSPFAAAERKIQIIAVSFGKE
mgnify:CR=1 FL=1